MNEHLLVREIIREVSRAYPNVWVMKVHGSPYQMAGVPDLLLCVHGLLIGCEVKHRRPGESEAHARGRTTMLQQSQIDQINEAGGAAATVLSAEEALALIERALRNREESR